MTTRGCYCILLRQATRRITAAYDAALKDFGITITQYSLLSTIRRQQPVSLTELGRLLELDRSTVGRNVAGLERLGLVEPTESSDQREFAVCLTEAGAEKLAAARPVWKDGLAALFDQLERI
jgi:DNA-binding MarR family transcriptional regulator